MEHHGGTEDLNECFHSKLAFTNILFRKQNVFWLEAVSKSCWLFLQALKATHNHTLLIIKVNHGVGRAPQTSFAQEERFSEIAYPETHLNDCKRYSWRKNPMIHEVCYWLKQEGLGLQMVTNWCFYANVTIWGRIPQQQPIIWVAATRPLFIRTENRKWIEIVRAIMQR